jgi:hypothetical protein
MRKTGLTEEVTWHLHGVASLFEFLDGLQFDKFGNLREGHIIHFGLGSKQFTVRLNSGEPADQVYRSMSATIPVTLPLPRRAMALVSDQPLDPPASSTAAVNRATPPRVGELIVCLFVPANRQGDRLADFAEVFEVVWMPRFGGRLARWVYIAQALRSAGAVVRIAAITALVDRVARAFGH